MKITSDRTAFCGVIGETIDIYQAEHAAAAAFSQLGGRAVSHGIRQKVIVGRDTSPAADMMEAAVCAALCASGADVLTVGVVPSAAVSYLTSSCDALMGVMITGGSMNYEISGLKFYQSSGRQVTGELLQSIHASIDGRTSLSSKQAGFIKKASSIVDEVYLDALNKSAEDMIFEKYSVAIDCTNSSAQAFAAKALESFGIDVKLFSNADPEDDEIISSYINRGALLDFVRDNQCDMGFAFSADGEACFAVDGEGHSFELEKLAAVCTKALKREEANEENQSMVLVSDDCHSALSPYLSSLGVECRVIKGDMAHLLNESDESRSTLLAADKTAGIVFPEYFYVPDGILTAIQVLKSIYKSEKKAAELIDDMPKLARAISTVVIPADADLPNLGYTDLPKHINKLREQLSGEGRVVLSRADKRVRILVEGVQQREVIDVAQQTERLVRKSLRVNSK